MMHKKNLSGFTFIELAVSITIVGLLIVGVLSGKMIIRNAKQKAIIGEANFYRTALYNFQLQYNALPGDMRNATAYWSGTANGDGSGIIGDIDNGMGTWIGWQTEGFRGLQQLALAKFISGTYTGVYGGGGSIGNNVAPSKISEAGVYFWCCDSSSVDMGHFFRWGGKGPDSAYNMPRQSILTPKEAYNIDTKIDDGFPFSGKLLGHRGKDSTGNWVPTTHCFDTSITPNTYNLGQTDEKCFVDFKPDDTTI